MLKIRPLKKYPVDLYYLVDVSASMHNNIEKLNSVGNDLSRKMAFSPVTSVLVLAPMWIKLSHLILASTQRGSTISAGS